jgi:predicted  nucleic acid-binding Zn-ribbon protein
MPYKTITLGLIEQQPELYERLRKSRTMLRAMDQLAIELKERHEALKEQLSRSQTGIHPSQIASAALEMAVKELEEQLATASRQSESETFSLDEAMSSISRRTPSA